MTGDEYQPVAVSRRICAPAHDIFKILADPARHLEFDGSESLRGAGSATVISGAGDVFVMKMYFPHLGDYEMNNHVVEYEQDRRIGWEPEAGRGHPHAAPDSPDPARWGQRWSYQLTPDGPDATIVTEIYDCSQAPEKERAEMDDGKVWTGSMARTLELLDTLCTRKPARVVRLGRGRWRPEGNRVTLFASCSWGGAGMAEPGDEVAAGAGGRGRLRASHADREQVIEVLKGAFVHGRLDRDEFDLRVGQAMASRTYADLAALTADIPARLTRPRLPEAAREAVNKKAVAAMAGATVAFIGTWPVMILTDKSLFVIPVAVVFFVLAMVVSTGWLVLLHGWLDQRAGRPSAPGLPPGADGEASDRPAPSGQLPSAGHGWQYTAEAARNRLSKPALPRLRSPYGKAFPHAPVRYPGATWLLT